MSVFAVIASYGDEYKLLIIAAHNSEEACEIVDRYDGYKSYSVKILDRTDNDYDIKCVVI